MLRLWDSLNPLTEFAIVFIALVGIAFHVRWSRRSTVLGPTLLTTLGIFFCFTGIAWGLLDFDPNNVKAGVPQLLQGIRTSFWASVVGIGFALTIKARHILFGDPTVAGDSDEGGATVDDLAEQLARLNRTLGGTDDAGVLGQVQRLREDNNRKLDQLTASFEKYAQKVADSNSKALINALQEVIRDFNAKINEQFGENFKQLNAAVGKLLQWQQRYELQLNALIEQETATRKNMTEASLRYAELVNKSTVFSTTAQALTGILAGIEGQRERMESSLNAFASLVDKAANGLPMIENRILEMTRQIEDGVRASHEQVSDSVKVSSQLLTTTLKSAGDHLNEQLRQATEESRKHVILLDKALEEELRRSIESLGRQLTALSQKFVQDYTPLTAQFVTSPRETPGCAWTTAPAVGFFPHSAQLANLGSTGSLGRIDAQDKIRADHRLTAETPRGGSRSQQIPAEGRVAKAGGGGLPLGPFHAGKDPWTSAPGAASGWKTGSRRAARGIAAEVRTRPRRGRGPVRQVSHRQGLGATSEGHPEACENRSRGPFPGRAPRRARRVSAAGRGAALG